MRTSEKSGTIAAALYAVHRDLENPRKDAKGQVRGNPNYRYLSLPALIDHAKVALKEAQVAVIQEVSGGAGWVEITTRFMHLTGEWLEVGPIFMPATGSAQEIGSAITYARRYALAAALNLAADEDDDAASASSPAQSHGAVASTRGRDGAEDREAGGDADAYGEGATVEPPASPTDAQRWMEEFHPGKPHKLVQSETVPQQRYCTQKTTGSAPCPYAVWDAKATRQEATT
jgi:hypothetical protein